METKREEEGDYRKGGTPEGRGEVLTGFREAHVSWGGEVAGTESWLGLVEV